MATRGQIAYLATPETIFTIYNHYDAYPSHLGKVLTTQFNSSKEAEDLVTRGKDIRFIDEDGTVERYDKGGYKLIKSEDPEDLVTGLYDHSDRATADYVYVWLEDKWVILPMNKGREYFIDTLLDQMRGTEPTMEIKDTQDDLDEALVRQFKHRAGIIK
jgi:hypothetical protein